MMHGTGKWTRAAGECRGEAGIHLKRKLLGVALVRQRQEVYPRLNQVVEGEPRGQLSPVAGILSESGRRQGGQLAAFPVKRKEATGELRLIFAQKEGGTRGRGEIGSIPGMASR